MVIKFCDNRMKGSWDGWVLFSDILNVYHRIISREKYLELCNCKPESYPFNYTAVDEKSKSVRVIEATRRNGKTLYIVVDKKVYLLNDEGKTIETII